VDALDRDADRADAAPAPLHDHRRRRPAPDRAGKRRRGRIPYAIGADVVVIGRTGSRALAWHAPADVLALAQGAGSVGVLVKTGHLLVVPLAGGRVADLDYPPGAVRAFRLASVGAIVETAAGIEIRREQRTTALPVRPGARLAGFADGQLVYALGDQIRAYFRRDGRDVLVRRVHPPFSADFDRRGLAWVSGRRVCWAVRLNVGPGPHGASC
jgi:hypothetical protein